MEKGLPFKWIEIHSADPDKMTIIFMASGEATFSLCEPYILKLYYKKKDEIMSEPTDDSKDSIGSSRPQERGQKSVDLVQELVGPVQESVNRAQATVNREGKPNFPFREERPDKSS